MNGHGRDSAHGSDGSDANQPSGEAAIAIDHQTPKPSKAPLPLSARVKIERSQSERMQDATTASTMARGSSHPSSGAETATEDDSPPRPTFSRLSTMPDQRVLDAPDTKNRPANQWTIPRSSKGSKGPRAATLFLGKDYERWQIHDRDNLGLGMKLGWNQRSGSSSALPSASEYMSGEDDDLDFDSDSFLTDDESASSSTKGSRRSSRRSSRSSRSRSGSGTFKRPGALGSSLQPLTATGDAAVTDRIEEQLDRRRKSASTASGQGNSPSRPDRSPSGSGFFKPRRFSSNGPDAAFMRHETVIGLHTPRRDSASSMASVGGRQLPAAFEKISITPLKPSTPQMGTPSPKNVTQEGTLPASSRPPSGQPSKLDANNLARNISERGPLLSDAKVVDSPAVQTPLRERDESPLSAAQATTQLRDRHNKPSSSSDLLKQAAAAAAASAEPSSESEVEGGSQQGSRDSLDLSSADSGRSTKDIGLLSHQSSSRSLARSRSPAVALSLARRRKPIHLEGTLYDKSGPFREGAVTDGLSVRLFSAEKVEGNAGWADSADEGVGATRDGGTNHSGRHGKPTRHKSSTSRNEQSRRSRRGVHRHEVDADKRAKGQDTAIEEDEDEGEADDQPGAVTPQVKDASSATTYLITTPDNRVASAAKLRRWAMDGEGRFYAAMEIKSVEAKIRSAMDPADANSSHSAAYARSLAKILRQTYLDDILNEVQKAETLNPGRESVAHLLVTSDGKYLRLEEDYPEEAFFVIAGCEDYELYPVVALVFCETLRHIHRFHNAGWMHGDIKLENLMFDARGNLVVIDYENANPFRIPGGDGRVALMSFDWVPPEAQAGPDGRRAGPSADLWALGANLVRAFALRDGIDDAFVREMVLESGQYRFLKYRDSLIKQSCDARGRVTADQVDLSPVLADADDLPLTAQCEDPNDPNTLPTPQRILMPFARQAPHLLKFVLASCLTLDPLQRSAEAELDGLELAEEIEHEHHGETMRLAHRAVETAIKLSGSEWVRPKLDEARRSLGLGDDEY